MEASTSTASTASPAKHRSDVRIVNHVPTRGSATTSDDLLFELWDALRLTNADVAQSPARDLANWTKSCVVVARIEKLVLPRVYRKATPSNSLAASNSLLKSSAELPWTEVDSTWRAPLTEATSDDYQARSNHDDARYLAFVDQDFQRRAADLPSEAQDRGSLRKYAPLVLMQKGNTRLHHVYFFENILLFVLDDGGWSSPVSPDEPRVSALRVQGTVRAKDIANLSYRFAKLGQFGAYGIDVLVKISQHWTETITLVLPTQDDMASWCNSLRGGALTGSSSDSFLDMFESDPGTGSSDLVNAIIAVPRWTSTSVPLDAYGALRKYAPVTIWIGGVQAQVGAYLFKTHLVFIYKTQADEVHVHRVVELAHVTYVSPSGLRGAALTLEDPASRGVTVTLSFYFSDDSTAIDWVATLQDRVDAPNSTAPKKSFKARSQSIYYPSPRKPTWYTAGLVFLTSAHHSDGRDLNIGVAIAPEFRSDGLATHAVSQALTVAFEQFGAHRVQARVLHSTDIESRPDAAWGPFIRNGFVHESTFRSSALDARIPKRWMDVSVLAILDLDWARQTTTSPQPFTLWDALFARHQREREALLPYNNAQLELDGQVPPSIPATESIPGISGYGNGSDVDSPFLETPTSIPTDISTWVEQQTSEIRVDTELDQDVGMSDSDELDFGYALTHR